MAFDADRNGKLTKSEVTDARLLGLFDRADANKDGTVTKEELSWLINGIEVEMDANESARKQWDPESDQPTDVVDLDANYKVLGDLKKKLEEAV